MKLRSKLLIGCGALLPLILFLALWAWTVFPWVILDVGCAFKAKNLCSSVFLSGRDEQWVNDEDLSFGPLFLVSGKVNHDAKVVRTSLMGLAEGTAVYREGLGCTIVRPGYIDYLREQAKGFSPPPKPDMSGVPWPQGDLLPSDSAPPLADPAKLDAALQYAFSEPAPPDERLTRAILIVHNGRIIAEQYSKGITRDTPLGGYSMTKSVTSALVGILVRDGKLDIKAPIQLWDNSGSYSSNLKKGITLDHLLRMSSGLEFDETYDDYQSDVVRMLYVEKSAAFYALNKPAVRDPDEEWYYSSGTTNIICLAIRRAVGGSDSDYWMFPRRELFEKIGMHSTTMEPDGSGTFVGSSFMFSTARDWARIGLLYLNDGVWNGERILPEGWVKYSTTPTPKAPDGQYGAHWWLNAGDPANPAKRDMPDVPRDAYGMQGYEGQRVMVIPSRGLVIVRLGQARPYGAFDMNTFAPLVLEAIGQPKTDGE